MAFVLIGLALLAMKLLELGPGADWSWWVVLTPFALAIVWWSLADSLGFTQARAMRKMDERTAARRAKAMHDLGMDPKRGRRGTGPRDRQR
jgi:small Trp-rich protein